MRTENLPPTTQSKSFDEFILPYISGLMIFMLSGFFKVANTLNKAINPNANYWLSDTMSFVILISGIVLLSTLFYLTKLTCGVKTIKKTVFYVNLSVCLSVIAIYLSDITWMFLQLKGTGQYGDIFGNELSNYIKQEWWIYAILLAFSIAINCVDYFISKKINNTHRNLLLQQKHKARVLMALSLISPLAFIILPSLMNILLFSYGAHDKFIDLPYTEKLTTNIIYMLSTLTVITLALIYKEKHKINFNGLFRIIDINGRMAALTLCMQVFFVVIPCLSINSMSLFARLDYAGAWLKPSILTLLPNVLLLALIVIRNLYKNKRFTDESSVEETTGNFGTASMAKANEIAVYYDPNNGIPTGIDEEGNPLYFPLFNKLTISPPGFWKTSASSIPVLLSHDGPVFVFDPKGELWAVTARYRTEKLKRKVVVIDPYGITKQKDFTNGKSGELLTIYYINPFDFVPEDPKERDRMINTFAASFIINECQGTSKHFDENAKILVRGYIDYMMSSLPKEARTLAMLYQIMSENITEAEKTFEKMLQIENSRAEAAANQIQRVGSDERGSILSTSYRQIDWMGDRNIQETLSHSNFDLNDFIKGNMDIFVVIPEDQINEHSRLFRMIMALLKSLIVRTPPSELPEKKMLFLLEELGQLGYTPDVEKCIQILRARGIIVWTIFQSLGQIEKFEDKNIFKSMQLKQIFTNDDIDTMNWVRSIGGKSTKKVKSTSINTGDTKPKMQMFGGQTSKGEGESIQETGVDLIHINEIRELPIDEQYIFELTKKVIRCKKIQYFDNPLFKGMYDPNPLESRGKQ